MGLGDIFRELLGDDRHRHHRQDRHNGYHDYDRHSRDREDCHSIYPHPRSISY